jgi:hypothetical protein
MLSAVRDRDQRLLHQRKVTGRWGVPTVTLDGKTEGLTRNGRTLILGEVFPQTGNLRTSSRFVVVDTTTLRPRFVVKLRGDFVYDALSPDARTLYVIQHVSQNDILKYKVRAYDLARGLLRPGAIADRTQRGWVMHGYPLSRVTSTDGRMVYTLYRNDGGFPFIHSLDAVRGTAHCIGVPWRAKQDWLSKLRLTLADGGKTLRLGWPRGRTFMSVDTRTYRVLRS